MPTPTSRACSSFTRSNKCAGHSRPPPSCLPSTPTFSEPAPNLQLPRHCAAASPACRAAPGHSWSSGTSAPALASCPGAAHRLPRPRHSPRHPPSRAASCQPPASRAPCSSSGMRASLSHSYCSSSSLPATPRRPPPRPNL
eukprot:7389751-Prymnesium_polylepis.1